VSTRILAHVDDRIANCSGDLQVAIPALFNYKNIRSAAFCDRRNQLL